MAFGSFFSSKLEMHSINICRNYVKCSYSVKRDITCSHILLDKNELNHKEGKLKGYAMNSYMRYMKNYEQMLEKRFPSAMQVYRIFSDGIRGFYHDLKSFFKIRYILLGNEEKLCTLSRKEIELYDKMPRDMLKIAPVLLMSSLPLVNYVVFPIAYYYPEKFLTSHFWTEEQKKEFTIKELKHRLQYNKIILKCLKSHTSSIKNLNLSQKWKELLTLIEKGDNLSLEQLLDCKSLFSSGPYSLHNLHFGHVNSLLRLHGVPPRFSRVEKLYHRAFTLKQMDNAITREGGVSLLSIQMLRSLCTIRGLHSLSMNEIEIIEWLETWIALSEHIDDSSYSLLLHAPFFLGYNNANNKELMN